MDRFVGPLKSDIFYYYFSFAFTCELGQGPKNGGSNPRNFYFSVGITSGPGPNLS